jgi:hypothetical protein
MGEKPGFGTKSVPPERRRKVLCKYIKKKLK